METNTKENKIGKVIRYTLIASIMLICVIMVILLKREPQYTVIEKCIEYKPSRVEYDYIDENFVIYKKVYYENLCTKTKRDTIYKK